jgi:transposase
MSTSLLYHAFCVRTYQHVRTEYRDGAVYEHLHKKRYARRCASCRHPGVTLQGRATATVRTLPIGKRPVFLVLHLHRVLCRRCGDLKLESRDVAAPRKSYSFALARLVLDLCKEMSLSAVAQHLRLDWHLCKDILMSDLSRRKQRLRLRRVRRIAVDEIFVKSPSHFLTVVLDLDSGQVLYVGAGKDAAALTPFFIRLRATRARLQAIAVDMSPAFLKAIQEQGPKGVLIIHDRFHVMKLMTTVLDQVRRSEQNRLESQGKKVLKGGRYLLLRNRITVEKDPAAASRLEQLLTANQTLHKVYLLKEDLRQLWEQPTGLHAHWLLAHWLRTARELKLRPLTRLCDTLQAAEERILSWYRCPISTGPLEGINNKIRVLNRRAYGHRDLDFLSLRILFIHETKVNLTGA